MEQHNEVVKDKDLKIEELISQNNLLEDENKIMKEANDGM